MSHKYFGIGIDSPPLMWDRICVQDDNRYSAKSASLLSASLTTWRKQSGKLIKQLAADIGVSPSTVSAWMSGRRSPSGAHLDALSAITGMPTSCMFCDHANCPGTVLIDGCSNRCSTRAVKGGYLTRSVTREIIQQATEFQDHRPTMEYVLYNLQALTGFACIAFRVKDEDGDFPYVASLGFGQLFVRKEDSLIALDSKGHVIRHRGGQLKLECMCGNVIRRRVDQRLPWFTAQGSFWTNSTTALLASTTPVDRRTETRNTCNTAGYESVGLFRMDIDGETVGLLQFNDRCRNMFSEDNLRGYEIAASDIAPLVVDSTYFRRR